jgi:hypothetical protein
MCTINAAILQQCLWVRGELGTHILLACTATTALATCMREGVGNVKHDHHPRGQSLFSSCVLVQRGMLMGSRPALCRALVLAT